MELEPEMAVALELEALAKMEAVGWNVVADATGAAWRNWWCSSPL